VDDLRHAHGGRRVLHELRQRSRLAVRLLSSLRLRLHRPVMWGDSILALGFADQRPR
jgi:hypothetical protein